MKEEIEKVILGLIDEHGGTDFPTELVFERTPHLPVEEVAGEAAKIFIRLAGQYQAEADGLRQYVQARRAI